MYDILIIGKGPAGLTAAIFAVRRGLKVLVLANPAEPSQMTEAPMVDNYPGILDVNGIEIMKLFEDHAIKLKTEIKNEEVTEIRKEKNHFVVKTDKTEHDCKSVIISTGAKHRKANIKGEAEFSGKGISYCANCDGPLFKGKSVFVVGGGDSALGAALMLEHMGVNDITIIHRRNEFRAVESLQKRIKKSKVKVMWDTIPVEIKGDRFVKSIIVKNVKTKKIRKYRQVVCS